MCPIVLKPFPTITDVGAKRVVAVGEGGADFLMRFLTFVHVQAFAAISIKTIFTLAVEGPLVLAALGEWVADAIGI